MKKRLIALLLTLAVTVSVPGLAERQNAGIEK